jgi:hypothetical protein
MKKESIMHFSKISRVAFLFSLISYVAPAASASEDHTRFNLWLHGQSEPFKNSTTTMKADLQVANLQLPNPTGYMYAGPQFELSKSASESVYLSSMFGVMTQNQFILSPRLLLGAGKFSSFTRVELYSKEWNEYAFEGLDYRVLPWLKTGGEYESWGSWAHPDRISHGWGPHVAFVFSHTQIDIAFQARRNPQTGHWFSEPQFRYHVFVF